MAPPESLIVHRELQALRAAAATHPRRRLSFKERDRRRSYERERWDKYDAVTRAGRRRRGRD